MLNNEPLVTVLLTVYNRPSVVNTIDSILKQTFRDFELLIVDNASEDNTCDVIRAYKDERIRLVVNEKNMGQTYSLNRGLELARGKYIARIDADDLAREDRLEKQVEFMESHEEYVLCGSWVQYINDNNQCTIMVPMPTTDKGFRIMQLVTCAMYHPAAMMRRSVLEKFHIKYDAQIRMAEDYEMWRKLMLCGKVCNIGEVLLYYRRGNSNDSKTHKETMKEESFFVRKKVCADWENREEAKEMLEVISLEERNHKSMQEAISIAKFYCKFLKTKLKKEEPDYFIVRKQFLLKTYASAIACNDAKWALILQRIYQLLLKIRYKMGKKKEEKE